MVRLALRWRPRGPRGSGRWRGGPALVRWATFVLLLMFVVVWSGTAAGSELLTRLGTGTLKQGSRGTAVFALQEALQLLGFNPGPADGWFGSMTRAAVLEFQIRSGLEPDGIVGPKTRQALGKALEALQGGDPVSRVGRYVVKPGDTLWAISRAAGVSLDALMKVNGLSDSVIYPGQRLVSPPPACSAVWVFAPTYRSDDVLALETVKDRIDHIDVVVDCSFSLRKDGTLGGTGNPELVSLVRNKGKLVLALVTNISGSTHDRAIASAVLTGSQARARALSSIRNLLNLGYDGICLDLENVDPQHRTQMSGFVRDLSTTLGQAAYLAVAVPAKTRENLAHGWSGAFDYVEIGKWCDAVVVMAYDQHHSTSSPGPVASLDWAEQVTSYALSCVPASKLLLGIPSYGYEWPASGGKGRSLPASRAQNIALNLGIEVSRDGGGVPSYRYQAPEGEYVVYYEDGLSLRRKMEMALSRNVAGVAMWRAGYETADTWESVLWYRDESGSGSR